MFRYFLWRIPFFGRKFFTSTSEVERKTDLIIQITPRIVEDNYSGIIKSESQKEAENSLNMNDKTKEEDEK